MAQSLKHELLEKIEEATQQITSAPTDATLLRQRGKLYVELGQNHMRNYRWRSDITVVQEGLDCDSALQCFGTAIESYQAAIESAPEEETRLFQQPIGESEYTAFCQAYMFRGSWYRMLKDYDALHKNALEALEHIPNIGLGAGFLGAFHADIAHYHVACGVSFFEHAQYEQALAAYHTAITTADFGYYGRGVCYYHLARYQEALADFKTALSQCDEDFDEQREPLMAWIEQCYQGLLEEQSTAHEAHVQQVRVAEHQRLTAELSRVLNQRMSTPTAVHVESFTPPLSEAQEEVFGIDLGKLRATLEQRVLPRTLREASFDLIAAILKIDQVGNIDPESAIGKARKVTEIVITDLHTQKFGQRGKDLFSMIKSLYKQEVLPKRVYNYFETVRKFGNLTVHYHPQSIGDVTKDDVKIIGLITAHIVQWYITEANP